MNINLNIDEDTFEKVNFYSDYTGVSNEDFVKESLYQFISMKEAEFEFEKNNPDKFATSKIVIHSNFRNEAEALNNARLAIALMYTR